MCGLAAIWSKKDNAISEKISDLCQRLSSRGPDSGGQFENTFVGLGHRRLSIIDLTSGDQPMYSSDRNVVIVFNGEIYNYRELRKELLSYGRHFHTTSDTEVLIAAYQTWGIKGALERLEGMFAFALYDQQSKQLYIARDRFGEKPLYYIQQPDFLAFASELKALLPLLGNDKKIDAEGLNLFLSLSYIPAPFTIYQSVRKLMPGSYFVIDSAGKLSEHRYYDLLERLQQLSVLNDYESASKELRAELFRSVEQRMVSDVPLGAFLSGGIDSSIVTAIMAQVSEKPVHTFSIGFTEKSYDESERAQLVADHIRSQHTMHKLNYADVVAEIDDIIQYFDEPFGDSSALPTHYVAQLARKQVKVVLTGDSADELFGGYEKYLGHLYAARFKSFPAILQKLVRSTVGLIPHNGMTNSLLRRVKKVLNSSELSGFELHLQLMELGFSDSERTKLLQKDYFADIKPFINSYYQQHESGNKLEKGFFTDLNLVLEGDMLVKVDRMCMKNSLEARVPFLDSKIVELAYRMPSDFKIRGRQKKYILKQTFKDLLPSATVRFRKKGFGVPVDHWFRNELKEEIQKLLSEEFIQRQGIFYYSLVKKLLDEHLSGKENHKGKLWNLFVFQKWYLKHVE